MQTMDFVSCAHARHAPFRALLLSAALLQAVLPARASATSPEPGATNAVPAAEAPLRRALRHLLALPILYYGPETELGAGANVSYYNRLFGAPQTSSLVLELSATTRQQFILENRTELFARRGDLRFWTVAQAKRFPDSYYGIGNATSEDDEESFTEQGAAADLTLHHALFWPRLRAGLQGYIGGSRLVEREPDGLLADDSVPGASRWFCYAAGPQLAYDSRDDNIATRRGSYAAAQALYADRALGSDFTYGAFRLDARHFWSPAERHTLAVQGVAEATVGTQPFHLMPTIGSVIRGYAKGRYRDRNLLALQAEYRFPIWRRLGGCLFAGAGDVFDQVGDLSWERLKFAGGPGLRYRVNDEGVNIRMDCGVSRQDGAAFYFTATEAF
jgi:outer membrane protein assembly factor BamA